MVAGHEESDSDRSDSAHIDVASPAVSLDAPDPEAEARDLQRRKDEQMRQLLALVQTPEAPASSKGAAEPESGASKFAFVSPSKGAAESAASSPGAEGSKFAFLSPLQSEHEPEPKTETASLKTKPSEVSRRSLVASVSERGCVARASFIVLSTCLCTTRAHLLQAGNQAPLRRWQMIQRVPLYYLKSVCR
jgi:hypothetical protein